MAQHDSKTPLNERDSWATPDYLFKWLDGIFSFDIDLAASADNRKTRYFLDINDNALDCDWFSTDWSGNGDHVRTGFLNPPYSKISPWLDQAIQEQIEFGFLTVMLIPMPNGESYYEKIFAYASELIFINGRISFIGSDGKPKGGNTRGSCVVVFGRRFGSLRVSNYNRDQLIEQFGGE